MSHSDNVFLIGVGTYIALQSVILWRYRQIHPSETYNAKWFQWSFQVLVGVFLLGWGAFPLWSKGR
jgi:hypothetical protein